jgi:hypothetical protein
MRVALLNQKDTAAIIERITLDSSAEAPRMSAATAQGPKLHQDFASRGRHGILTIVQ